MARFYQSFVKPLAPQTAPPVPIGPRDVAQMPTQALPPRFAQAEAFVAPPKFGLAVAAATFLPGWTSTNGIKAVALPHAQAEAFAAPPKFGLIVAAATFLPGRSSTDGLKAQPQGFAPGNVAAPDKFGITAPAAPML